MARQKWDGDGDDESGFESDQLDEKATMVATRLEKHPRQGTERSGKRMEA